MLFRSACIIGAVAGVLVVFGVWLLDNVLHVDDPVGAVAVHCMNGIWGTLAVGLFATESAPGYAIANASGKTLTGLFYGGGFELMGLQLLGFASVAAWTAVTITITFLVIKAVVGLRVTREEELIGLDATEHGLPSAYGGFAFVYDDTPADLIAQATGDVPVKEAVPVEVAAAAVEPSAPVGGVKMTKIDILCKMERFDALKRAMFDIGITGMTATNVMGCGEQRGKTEGYFRGAKVEATMLPSMQVSIVVSKLPVSLVVNTARKILYTGNIGDGKIFISNVENVIKVRTGEQGYDALQDEAAQ